jgi:hypothetical protein
VPSIGRCSCPVSSPCRPRYDTCSLSLSPQPAFCVFLTLLPCACRDALFTDRGAYYHPLFVRDDRELCRHIRRAKCKGLGPRKPSNPHDQPNLYHPSSDLVPRSLVASRASQEAAGGGGGRMAAAASVLEMPGESLPLSIALARSVGLSFPGLVLSQQQQPQPPFSYMGIGIDSRLHGGIHGSSLGATSTASLLSVLSAMPPRSSWPHASKAVFTSSSSASASGALAAPSAPNTNVPLPQLSEVCRQLLRAAVEDAFGAVSTAPAPPPSPVSSSAAAPHKTADPSTRALLNKAKAASSYRRSP